MGIGAWERGYRWGLEPGNEAIGGDWSLGMRL